jgi:hypothetical protein
MKEMFHDFQQSAQRRRIDESDPNGCSGALKVLQNLKRGSELALTFAILGTKTDEALVSQDLVHEDWIPFAWESEKR